jgi:glutathione S-transferase
MESGLSPNVHNDLDWMEHELSDGRMWLLPGDEPTAADVMNLFNIDFIFERKLGVAGAGPEGWPNIRKWVERCKARAGYRKAVERTGYKL